MSEQVSVVVRSVDVREIPCLTLALSCPLFLEEPEQQLHLLSTVHPVHRSLAGVPVLVRDGVSSN